MSRYGSAVHTVMDVFNLNSMIKNRCIRKMILSENCLLARCFTLSVYITYFIILSLLKCKEIELVIQ